MLHVRREFLLVGVALMLVVSCGTRDTIETTPPEKELEVTTTTATTTTTTVDPSVALAAGLEYSVAWLSYVFPKAAAVQHADAAQTNGVTKPPGYDGCSGSRNGEGLTGGALSCEPVPSTGNGASGTPAPTGLEPCGGDLPPCWVKKKESGGSYTAYNPTGCGGRSCGGAWQFDPRTWNGYGGYQFAQDAPPEVQDAKARELWANGAGCSHWAACR